MMPGASRHSRLSDVDRSLDERIGQLDEAQAHEPDEVASASWRSATAPAACGSSSRSAFRPPARLFFGCTPDSRLRLDSSITSVLTGLACFPAPATGAGGRRSSAYAHCRRWPAPCLPGRLRGCVVGKDADDVERVQIAEFGAAEALQFAAENQMQKLFSCRLPRPCSISRFCKLGRCSRSKCVRFQTDFERLVRPRTARDHSRPLPRARRRCRRPEHHGR